MTGELARLMISGHGPVTESSQGDVPRTPVLFITQPVNNHVTAVDLALRSHGSVGARTGNDNVVAVSVRGVIGRQCGEGSLVVHDGKSGTS